MFIARKIVILNLLIYSLCTGQFEAAPLGYFPSSWYSTYRKPSPLWQQSEHHAVEETAESQLIKATIKELSKAGISKADRETCITKLRTAVSAVSHQPMPKVDSTTNSKQVLQITECCAAAGLDDLAEEMAQCSLNLAQQQGQKKESIEALDSLAGSEYKKSNCDHAVKLLNQALDIQKSYSFKGPSDTGLLLNHLAFCYSRAKKFDESERALNQAIKSDGERMGNKSFAVAEDTYNLGVTEVLKGDLQQGEVTVKRALEMLSELPQDSSKQKVEWSKFLAEVRQRRHQP